MCCSCAACVLVCPHHVLDYDFEREKPFQTDEELLFGRTRKPEEVFGISQEVVVARAADPGVVGAAQDGGASALVLLGLQTGALDGAVVSAFDGRTQMTEPRLIRTAEDVLTTARSRYTYCPTPLALKEAFEQRLRKIALVGVSCEITAAPKMAYAGVRKWSNRIALTVGLMCSRRSCRSPSSNRSSRGPTASTCPGSRRSTSKARSS